MISVAIQTVSIPMPEHEPEKTACLIVNYENAALTLECLAALKKMRDCPAFTLVLDTSGQKTDWNGLESEELGLKEIDPEKNIPAKGFYFWRLWLNSGYGSANNAGMRLMLDKHDDISAFWILNNDAFPHDGALSALCEKLNRGYDVAGSTLLAENGLVQTAAGGQFSPFSGCSRFIGNKTPFVDAMRLPEEKVEKKLAYIDGASLLCRRKLCQPNGYFPEDYFLYYEDVEAGLKNKKRGAKLGWAKNSLVTHKSGASTKNATINRLNNYEMDCLVLRNRYQCVARNFPGHLPFALLSLFAVLLKRKFLDKKRWK